MNGIITTTERAEEMSLIKMYGISFTVFFAIDLIWLGLIAKNLYREHLGYIMSPSVNWVAAIGFYIFYIAGLIFFAIAPAIERDSLLYAAFVGAFFGFITYATYDMTNLATLKDWPVFITVVDIIWGTVLCGLTASVSFIILKAIGI